jgi:hypothetical protein
VRHPLLRSYVNTLARHGRPDKVRDFDERRLTDLIIEVEYCQRTGADLVEKYAHQAFNDQNKEDRLRKLACALVSCLFKVGAIGVKLSPEHTFRFCYDEDVTINEEELSLDCRVKVHPMIVSALGCETAVEQAA